MKVETVELADSEVALSLEIDEARFQRAMDAAYRRAAVKVNIAGFRRGKAPRPLVERVVGRESLVEDALGQLLPEVFSEAVVESEIHPVMDPEFDVESLNPLRAKATVVVEPVVTLGDYRSIRREPKPTEIEAGAVDTSIQHLRERNAEWVPVERSPRPGDLVTVNVVGESEGATVFRREEVDYLLDSASDSPIPGFAEQVVGAEPGQERAFELPVPTDQDWGPLAGKTVAFRVHVLDVKERELPELDDNFAETLGHTDLATLKAHVEGELREVQEVAARMALEREVVDEALLFCTVKVPAKLVEHQTRRAYERLAQDLDSRGLTIEQYLRARGTGDEELRATLRADAERSLKRRFVLQRIAAEESLDAPEEEVEAELLRLISLMNREERGASRGFQMERARESVRSSVLETKAAQWLFQNATGIGAPVPTGTCDPDGESQP